MKLIKVVMSIVVISLFFILPPIVWCVVGMLLLFLGGIMILLGFPLIVIFFEKNIGANSDSIAESCGCLGIIFMAIGSILLSIFGEAGLGS